MKKKMTIDRLLLVLILIMQIGIFASFHINSQKEKSTITQQANIMTPAINERNQEEGVNRPNPFALAGFEHMHNQMNRMMAQAMNEFEYMQELIDADDIWQTMPATPAMDMRETENSYMIALSLPGISPTDIIVTLEGKELTILSPSHGSDLNTRILMPGPVMDSAHAKSFFTNGVLTVNVPKNRENLTGIDNKIGL